MRLRNRVRVMRRAAGLSQVELAAEVGISRPTLSYIEQDDGHEPIARHIEALCRALGDPVLFWWEESAEDERVEVAV